MSKQHVCQEDLHTGTSNGVTDICHPTYGVDHTLMQLMNDRLMTLQVELTSYLLRPIYFSVHIHTKCIVNLRHLVDGDGLGEIPRSIRVDTAHHGKFKCKELYREDCPESRQRSVGWDDKRIVVEALRQ